MVRHAVMRLGHADPRIGPAAQLAADLQAADARDVALVRQVQQVHQQLGVRVVLFRHARRLLDGRQRRRLVGLLGALNPRFDVAHRIEIVAHDQPIARRRAAARAA